MAQDRWDQIGGLLEAVLARPEEKRQAFLREACDDPAVRAEVTSLLELTDEARDYFDRLGSAVQRPQDAVEPGVAAGADPLELEGRRVGRYVVKEHLGGGGMGLVYRARDTQLGRPVALKFLPPHLAWSEEAEERFVREAQATARLDHPNIATVHEIGETDAGRHYIAMAYYDGETLKEKLTREGALPVDEAVGYAIQIAEGLQRAHAAGIVHRDVKPANVIVTERGEVKLVDFGLAQMVERSRLTNPGRRLGTAAYMSPEQAEGEAVDARTDLWAVGVLLYEMLTGERPFQAASETAVLHAVLHDEPEPVGERRSEVPAAFIRIVDRLLAKDVGARYASAETLVDDLRAAGANEVAASSAPSSPPTAGHEWSEALSEVFRRARFSPRWLGTGGAVLAVLLFVLSWVLWPAEPAPNNGSAADRALATAGTSPPSIAVLPFESIGRGEAGGLTEGIHGDILTRLSNISALKVISRTSVQQYRAGETPTSAIGEELGAGWVVEGEVQEAGGTVQVNARLINARSGREAWARSYQRELTAENLFEIQAEITRDIASSLRAELTRGEQKRIAGAPTEDLEAYRHYVRGRRVLDRPTSPENLRQAAGHFQQALRQDSTYALAWAGLADAIGRGLYERHDPDSLRLPEVSREEAARRALEMDPSLAEAHAALGNAYYDQHKGPAIVRSLERAIELKPSYAEAHRSLSIIWLILGRPESGLKHASLAMELSPNFYGARIALQAALFSNGKYEEGLTRARRYLDKYPEQEERPDYVTERGQSYVCISLIHLKRWNELQAFVRRRQSKSRDKSSWLTFYSSVADIATGDTTSSRSRIQEFRSREEHWKATLLLAALGEVDAAFKALPGPEEWPIWLFWKIRYQYSDFLAGVREDPRYDELIREVNRYWGLNPDGSVPEDSDASLSADPEADE